MVSRSRPLSDKGCKGSLQLCRSDVKKNHLHLNCILRQTNEISSDSEKPKFLANGNRSEANTISEIHLRYLHQRTLVYILLATISSRRLQIQFLIRFLFLFELTLETLSNAECLLPAFLCARHPRPYLAHLSFMTRTALTPLRIQPIFYVRLYQEYPSLLSQRPELLCDHFTHVTLTIWPGM